MKRLAIVLALLLLLPACGQAGTTESPSPDEAVDYEALAAATPVAQAEGETVSPDGRFEARAVGASGDYISGVQPPEFLQIVDRETEEVLWQDHGWLSQSVLWSPEGGCVALARTARTWCSIAIIETENWTEWEFTLPDGSAIPEYTFLPDDEPWGVWVSEGSLDLVIGRGDDAGGQKYYTCGVKVTNGKLSGTVWEEAHAPLLGTYDFNHDGAPEIVEAVTVYGDEARNQVGWYELRVRAENNSLYWSRSLHESHPGWGSYFACRVEGQDYLLRYTPVMYQGCATYSYQLFSLDEAGEELVVREGGVEFDENFGSPVHGSFDPADIAAFLEEVHRLLEGSELLLTTESGDFRSGGSGVEFHDDLDLWTTEEPYDGGRSLEENIRAIGEYWRKMREGT